METDRTAPRVLLVGGSDVLDDIERVARQAHPEHAMSRVPDWEDGIDLVEERRFEVVVADLDVVPEGDALGDLKDGTDGASVVVLADSEDAGKAGLSDGADDYLVRGQVDDPTLRRMLRYADERSRVERKLRRSEDRFDSLVESIEDGYFEVDLSGTFTFVNDYMCRRSGYDRGDFLGTTYTEFVDDDNAKKLFNAFHVLYETGIPLKLLDFQAVGKDGERIPVEASVFLKRDDEGRKIGFWGILRDVSARKRAEEQLASLRGEPE